MTRFSAILVVCLLLQPGPAPRARADLLDCVRYLRAVAGKAKRTYRGMAIKDLSFTDLEVSDSLNGEVRPLHLREQVGSGCRGSVYRIDPGPDGMPRVAKIEMSYRLPVLPKHKAIIPESTAREWVVTRTLQDAVPEIEKSKYYPKDPAWMAGSFPVVPILEVHESGAGMVLIKPEVLSPKKLSALKLGKNGELDPVMEKALHDFYDLSLAVRERVPAVGTGIKEGMQIDIGTTNLFWVESPEDLKRFHLKRPGFCLFEVDQSSAFEWSGGKQVLNPNRIFYPDWESYKKQAIREIRAL